MIHIFEVGLKFMSLSKNSIIKHNSFRGFNSKIFKQGV